MSRRSRAAAFAIAALACAAVAALVADSYGTTVASQYGELRPVVVAARDLPEGEPIDPRDAGRLLEVRRVPASFVPPDAVMAVGDAVGREAAVPLPAGSYVLASQLRVPRPRRGGGEPAIAEGLRPVEITVTGTEALSAAGRPPQGQRVDVIVTTEPDVGDAGRTYVAAEGVELLALTASAEPGGGDALGEPTQTATLALTRAQALRLIEAENFARQVRLMAHVE
jgi:Flp pilus assembly protein CpaB